MGALCRSDTVFQPVDGHLECDHVQSRARACLVENVLLLPQFFDLSLLPFDRLHEFVNAAISASNHRDPAKQPNMMQTHGEPLKGMINPLRSLPAAIPQRKTRFTSGRVSEALRCRVPLAVCRWRDVSATPASPLC
jgi:hypothetical protein